MPMTIAVAGKGGVGTTTCVALLLRSLVLSGLRPILAVDADPNVNLHALLGLPMPETLGGLREESRALTAGAVPAAEILEARVAHRVSEGRDVDLVAMGRGEGPGCYCFVNSLLRQSLARLSRGYRAVVVDNEAGMEHLSRRNLAAIDHLLLVSDPSPRGLAAAAALHALAGEIKVPARRMWLLVNRPYAPGEECAASLPAEPPLLAEIPHDPALPAWEARGGSLLDIPAGSASSDAFDAAARRLLAAG